VDLDHEREGERLALARLADEQGSRTVLRLERVELRRRVQRDDHIHRLPEDQRRAGDRAASQQREREVAGGPVLPGDPQQVDPFAGQDG